MEDRQIAQTLDKQISAGVVGLWEVFSAANHAEERVAAVLKLGLLSMARAPLEAQAPAPPHVHPPWLDVARTAISGFVDKKPEREVLLRTVFFRTDLMSEHHLDVLVSSSVVPAGLYDDRSFAAGVAAGDITVRS